MGSGVERVGAANKKSEAAETCISDQLMSWHLRLQSAAAGSDARPHVDVATASTGCGSDSG